MKQLNVFYRAFTDYRAQTTKDRSITSQRANIARTNPESDKIVLTRQICTVKEDWIEAIENGLVYIEKAIKEERQFIRSNGEVEPIEKVKNVSRDSVEHLAKHSNLLTRESEGENIIPDQLYTVERLSDYAVYENRFLYMLLCYLRDFITLRYNNILELSNTYNGSMNMNKTIKLSNRKLLYTVKMEEERRDDKYLRDHNEAKEIIERIDLLLKAVVAFLATPLMEFVAKVPMIKPPIVKTNVLKMNNNFKQAVELYSFVTTYEGDGYTVETQVKEISPFSDNIADEIAETILLSSFLTYEHSLGLEPFLKDIYNQEQQKLKEEEHKRFLEKLEAARIKVKKSEMSYEEYIVMLESHNRSLQKRCEALDSTRQALENTKKMLKDANENIARLNETLAQAVEELEVEKKRYIDDMAALKIAHEEEIASLNEAHAQEISDIRAEYDATISELNNAHEQEIQELNTAHIDEINNIQKAHEEQVASMQAQIDDIDAHMRAEQEAHAEELAQINDAYALQIQDKEQTIHSFEKDKEELEARCAALLAQIHGLRKEQGKAEEVDYSTKEGFAELENMYEQFTLLYKEQWSKTKEKIRNDLLKPYKKSQKIAKRMQKQQAKQKDKQ